MTSDPTGPAVAGAPGPEEQKAAEDSWREVGRQFHALGVSLAAAFRASVESEESRQHLKNLQSGLEDMAKEIGSAMTEAAASPPARDIRIKAEKAATTARFATEDALQEARPQILSALRQINQELTRIIDRVENKKPEDPGAA